MNCLIINDSAHKCAFSYLKNIPSSHISPPGFIFAFLPLAAPFLSHIGFRLLDLPWSGQGHEGRGKDCNGNQGAAGTRAGLWAVVDLVKS